MMMMMAMMWMMMKCQFHWWRTPEYPEKPADLGHSPGSTLALGTQLSGTIFNESSFMGSGLAFSGGLAGIILAKRNC